jgi:hypothetical protein
MDTIPKTEFINLSLQWLFVSSVRLCADRKGVQVLLFCVGS